MRAGAHTRAAPSASPPAVPAGRARLAGAGARALRLAARPLWPTGARRGRGVGCWASYADSGSLPPVACDALVVGGGPVGLASALMLSRRGVEDIVVVEKRGDPNYFEADRSFVFNINGRGQMLTNLLGCQHTLEEVGLASKEIIITILHTDGRIEPKPYPVKEKHATTYWIPRYKFTKILNDLVAADPNITSYNGCELSGVDLTGPAPVVSITSGSAPARRFAPHLLVGADGQKSRVRAAMAEHDTSGRFEPVLFPSGSSGLRYKVLSLDAAFPLNREGSIRAEPNMGYSFRGQPVPSLEADAIRLGMLPTKDPVSNRTANLITLPEHPVWGIKTEEDMYDFLEDGWPQLPIREMVPRDECARFAASRGGAFPTPQYTKGAAVVGREGATVLVGDALHSFPPDLGEGVNSGLQDVVWLGECLDDAGGDVCQGAEKYEERRVPQAEAICKLVQTVAPWQYSQNPKESRKWAFNVALQIFASTVLPFLVPKHPFLLIQNPALNYTDVWAGLVKGRRAMLWVKVVLTAAAAAAAAALARAMWLAVRARLVGAA